MGLVLYYIFHCSQCRARIQLPLSMLPAPLEHLPVSSTVGDSVVLACDNCKRVDNYSLKKSSALPDSSEDRAELLPQTLIRGFVSFLECGDRDCHTPLRVIEVRNADTTDEEDRAEQATWIWESLTCPNGHPIRRPQSA
jgi:hypothetical protein